MNIGWLENYDVKEVFIDSTYLMRLVNVNVDGKNVYLFTPPCHLISNISTVKDYNSLDLKLTANMTPMEISDIAKKLDLEIVDEHETYVELARKNGKSRVKMIMNVVSEHRLSSETNPVLVPNTKSLLEDLREKRKIASYLKFFTLFSFSKTHRLEFVLKSSSHIYDVSSRSVVNPTFLTGDDEVIINDASLEPRLRQYLDVSIRNSAEIVESFKRKLNVDFFTHVVELENLDNHKEILFSSLDGLSEFVEKHKNKNRVSHTLLTHSILAGPFYFSNDSFLGGKLFIAQPVLSLKDGLNTCVEWKRNQRNSASVDHLAILKQVGYTVYHENIITEGDIRRTTFIIGEQIDGEDGCVIMHNSHGKIFAMLQQNKK